MSDTKGLQLLLAGRTYVALLNLNNHTSYFSHAVYYSHEYVRFWYV